MPEAVTNEPAAMQRGDLALWRYLATRGLPVTVLAITPVPHWVRALPGLRAVCTAVPPQDPTSPPGVVVAFDAVDAAALLPWRERGATIVCRHGSGWRVAAAPTQARRRAVVDWLGRYLPCVAGRLGVLPLRPPFRHDGGHCWWVSLRSLRRPASKSGRVIAVFENGRPMPFADSVHDDIRELGGGRHSVWQDGLYFSASDGSDPAQNGRSYEARVVTPGADGELTVECDGDAVFARHLQQRAATRTGAAATGRRVLVVISSLGPGGAERQFAYLVRGLVGRGFEVGVLSLDGFEGVAGHYLSLLQGLDVARLDGRRAHPDFVPTTDAVDSLARLPESFARDAWLVATNVGAFAPDVLHCALDKPNVLGALVGVCLAVPRIVMSLRNVNPSHIPRLDLPWFRPWYRVVADLPGVVLSANSRAGAADYAGWIGVPAERIVTVHNGLDGDAVRVPTDGEVAAFRRGHGLDDADPAVVGVFRISAEKRPVLWLDVIAALRRRWPRLHAFHVGDGPDAASMDARIAELGLREAVHRLGRQADPGVAVCAADLLLLVSEFEGVPNVALETQWLRRPVVCTRAGGTAESVRDDETGLVVDEPSVTAITAACAELLADRARARRMGDAGRAFVAETFAVDRMVEESIALYR